MYNVNSTRQQRKDGRGRAESWVACHAGTTAQLNPSNLGLVFSFPFCANEPGTPWPNLDPQPSAPGRVPYLTAAKLGSTIENHLD